MQSHLDQMRKTLEEKENEFENNEEYKISENYNEILKNIEKKKKILEDCSRFYTLLKQKDEAGDEEQAKTSHRNNRRKRTYENEDEMRIDMEDMSTPLQADMTMPKIERRPLTSEEEKYLEKWDEYSKQMDEILKEVADELEIMLNKLDVINQEQNKNMDMANQFSNDINKLQEDVEMSNKYLKKIVTELRSPGKICADLTLGLILSVLIGVLVYVVRLYFSLE